MMDQQRARRIAKLNDEFRRVAIDAALLEASPEQVPGRFVVTQGFAVLPVAKQIAVLDQVKLFDDFTKANDPYGEHDFGIVKQSGDSFYWKIDYYDKSLEYGSEDPADPAQTTRVMTVMCSYEY
jgi:hypothetical protein